LKIILNHKKINQNNFTSLINKHIVHAKQPVIKLSCFHVNLLRLFTYLW